jgi:AcrR family transcriptional regulator
MSVRAIPRPVARAERQRLNPADREAELLRAARALLREVGYEKFQPAEVARRSGVSTALVYRYFPTKRDLLGRVAEDWLAEILAHEPDLSGCTSTYERLRDVIAYGLDVIRAEPALTRYILLELRAEPTFRGSAVHQLNRRFTGLVIRVLRDAIAQGEFRDDISLTLLRDTVFGAIEHQTWAYLRGEGDFRVQRSAAAIAAVICGGMQAPPPVEAVEAGAGSTRRSKRNRPAR